MNSQKDPYPRVRRNMTDNNELVNELFGDEFDKKLEEKKKEREDDEVVTEIQLRMSSVLECVNKAKVDTEHILAHMDADKHGDAFEYLETLYEALIDVESELSQDEYGEITERDYELPKDKADN